MAKQDNPVQRHTHTRKNLIRASQIMYAFNNNNNNNSLFDIYNAVLLY